MKLVVVGAGAWGTALACSLAQAHEVTLWARDAAQQTAMQQARSNERYLPGIPFPPTLALSTDLAAELISADRVLVAVPTAALRETLARIAQIRSRCDVVWVCKGFESGSGRMPHQIVAESLPADCRSAVLSGPSFAQEVARGLPTALVLASADEAFARETAAALHHARLRIYASNDLVGVEIGGAVKNVMAIAAGLSDGMALGYNARAALLTRGLAEITRLGLKLGGRAETLSGLSGVGDLILTCTGDLSRNRQVGLMLARGLALDDILHQLGHVAEGVHSVREVTRLARDLGVEMPICDAVYRVLHGEIAPQEMLSALLKRAPQGEFE